MRLAGKGEAMSTSNRRTGNVARLILAGAIVLSSAAAAAATDAERITELERKLDESLRQIQSLSQQLQELKRSATPQRPATAAPAGSEPLTKRVDELEQRVSDLANQPESDHGLDVHGFADVGFVAAPKGRDAGANIGALDFYLTPKLGERFKALFELNFECCDDGHMGVDLERMQIGYTASDALTLWAGRFHTPFGYWNTAFHHGAQLQTAVLRPKFLDFEDAGGVLPVHTVGLWSTGTLKSGRGRLGYDLYVGNAPTIQMSDPLVTGSGTLDPGLSGAGGRRATVGGNLRFEFGGALTGFSAGVHALTSHVVDTAAIPNATRLTMFGGWLAYLENDWEVLAEEYAFRNRDLSGASGSHSSNAWYAQLGRQFGQWTPYGRYEIASLDQADAYFAQQESGQSYKRMLVGVRYDLNPKTALKLEAHHTRLTDRATGSYSELRGQIAVRF
jgi:hypothetical protein